MTRRSCVLALACLACVSVVVRQVAATAEGAALGGDAGVQAAIPHISQCSRCHKCIVDEPPPTLSPDMPLRPEGWRGPDSTLIRMKQRTSLRTARRVLAERLGGDPALELPGVHPPSEADIDDAPDAAHHHHSSSSRGRRLSDHSDEDDVPADSQAAYLAELLRPVDEEQKRELPKCTICRGCNVELEAVEERAHQQGAIEYHFQAGSMKNWIFWATVNGKEYIVKVYNQQLGQTRKHHTPRLYGQAVQAQFSTLSIARDCGVDELYPNMWIANISAIVPDEGFHVRYMALFYEVANGVPLHDLLHMIQKRRPREPLIPMLDTGLNSTQVLIGVTMDLLISMCDRHKGNIIVSTSGGITYIDQERILGIYPACGYNSVMLPGSRTLNRELLRLYELDAFSDSDFQWLNGTCSVRAFTFAKFDYRCHVKGGEIGTTNYPKAMDQCLRFAAGSTPKAVAAKYNMPEWQAQTVVQRAHDMLTHGFEWALRNGQPANGDRFLVPWQPACCSLNWDTNEPWPVCTDCWRTTKPQRPS